MTSLVKKAASVLIPGKLLQYGYLTHASRAIILEKLQLIYVPIPKVANRSIKSVLQQKVGLPPTLSSHKAQWKYIPLSEVANHAYHSFGFVRNPLDRLVSCYVQKVRMQNPSDLFWKYGNQVNSSMSFEDFVGFVCKTPDRLADRHFKSQHHFLFRKDQLMVDFIGKFENIKTDWAKISAQYQLGSLDHANQSERLGLEHYYTKELALKVALRYQKDIELLDYKEELELFISSLS